MLEKAENRLQTMIFRGTTALKTREIKDIVNFQSEILASLSSLPRITNQAEGMNDYQRMLVEAMCEFCGIIAHISKLVDEGVINESGKLGPMIELGFMRKQIRRLAELEMRLNENKSSRHIEQIDM